MSTIPRGVLLACWLALQFGEPARSEPPPPAGQKPPGEKNPLRTDLYGDPLPPGALVRMGTVRWRQSGRITGIVFSRDGQMLTTAGGWQDESIHFWELNTGRLVRVIPYGSRVAALALSGDGKTLAAAGFSPNAGSPVGRINLWDFPTGKRLLDIHRSGWEPRAVAFAPNGKTLATLADGGLHLWDARSGNERFRIAARPQSCSVIFSPDGRALASVSDSGIQLWDPASGQQIRRMEAGRYRYIRDIAFSPDGKTLAAVGWPEGPQGEVDAEKHALLWDVGTGKIRTHFKLPLKGLVVEGGPIEFSPDGGTFAAAGGDGTISLWEILTGKKRLQIRASSDPIEQLAFSPDGKTLASRGYGEQMVRVWDVATGREFTAALQGHGGVVRQVAFGPDGRTLVTASDDSTIRFWDVTTSRQRHQLAWGGQWSPRVMALSPDAKTLASWAFDDPVRLWATATGRQVQQLPVAEQARGHALLAFSLDGKRLASWADDWHLRVWDVGSAKKLLDCQPRLTGVNQFPSPPDRWEFERRSPFAPTFAFTRDGTKLAIRCGSIHVADVTTGEESFSFRSRGIGSALAISPDGRILALPSEQEKGQLLELASGQEVLGIDGLGEVSAISFSPDGRWLAAAVRASKGTVGLWDARTGRRLLTLQAPGAAYSLAFAPDGKTLAVGLSDTTALIWDLSAASVSEQRPAKDLTDGELATVWALLASADARRAYSAVWTLVAAADKAPSFLKAKLPLVSGQAERIQKFIADLDSNQFAVREGASRELASLGAEVRPALGRALTAKPSVEARRRLEELLAVPAGPICNPEDLRHVRAIQALEQIGSKKSRQLLENLAQGSRDARLTLEASAALERLGRQTGGQP